MTDRIDAMTVVLDHDIRIDDVQPLVEAIKQLRGVLSVELHVADFATSVAEARRDFYWKDKLLSLMRTACIAAFLCSACIAAEPTVRVDVPLTQAVASGQTEILVTTSGELTDTLRLKPGQKLTCAEGVTLKFNGAKNGIEVADGNEIRGCILAGSVGPVGEPPTVVTTEGPHGISCRGVDGVRIDVVSVHGFGGDGLYVGSTAGTPASNIRITGSNFSNNGRHGLTITAGRDVTVDGCGTGFNAMNQVDVEPGNAQEVLEKISITNHIASGNDVHTVYNVGLARLTNESAPVSITIEGAAANVGTKYPYRVVGFGDETPARGFADVTVRAVWGQPE